MIYYYIFCSHDKNIKEREDMKEDVLVTAVITTYKRDINIVSRALMSIVNQTYSYIEIIIVNDYPTDYKLVEGIRNLVSSVSNQCDIQYFVVEQNGGACKARNLALKYAKGKYIAFLDDDDEWITEKIKRQVMAFEKKPDCAIVYCNALIRYANLGTERIRFGKNQPEGNIFNDMLSYNIIGSCSFPMFVTSILRDYNGFREDMPALQDWELYLRILKRYPAAYVHEVSAIYNFYEGERISSHPERRIQGYENIQSEFSNELSANREHSADFYLMGAYFYSFSSLKVAFKYYKMGVCRAPLRVKRNLKDLLRMIGRKFIKSKAV